MNYDSLYTVIDIEEYKGLSSDKKKYSDGSVKDGRWFIDIPSKILGGGYSD